MEGCLHVPSCFLAASGHFFPFTLFSSYRFFFSDFYEYRLKCGIKHDLWVILFLLPERTRAVSRRYTENGIIVVLHKTSNQSATTRPMDTEPSLDSIVDSLQEQGGTEPPRRDQSKESDS